MNPEEVRAIAIGRHGNKEADDGKEHPDDNEPAVALLQDRLGEHVRAERRQPKRDAIPGNNDTQGPTFVALEEDAAQTVTHLGIVAGGIRGQALLQQRGQRPRV